MSLCKLTNSFSMDSHIVLENLFLSEYMPQAESDFVKVYLFGLFQCMTPNESDNSLDGFSKILGLSQSRIEEAFEYWQQIGLVQLVSKNPIEVRYLPIKENSGYMKKVKPEKYQDFNKMLEALITERVVTPNELNEYYHFIETNNFEAEALLSIVRYCILLKGPKINYPYILTVARSFADDGLKTEEAVSKKLEEQERASGELKTVLRALGLRRDADPEERTTFLKWTRMYGFDLAVILHTARLVKGKGGFSKLDSSLTKYYQHKLFTIQEIENFSQDQEKMFDLAKEITRSIGVFYQNLDNIVQTYIRQWQQKGFDSETLVNIADYCFKNSIRTLEGMDTVVQKFFKLGLVSKESIDQYIGTVVKVDQKIQQVLNVCGILRSVNSWDRDYYRTWTYSWNLPDEVILFAAKEAKGKEIPMAYLNKILSTLQQAGITTLKDAEKHLGTSLSHQNQNREYEQRTYSEKEIAALFSNLDDIEV